jgi:ankyrin repeat protein
MLLDMCVKEEFFSGCRTLLRHMRGTTAEDLVRPLNVACKESLLQIVRALISAGADVNRAPEPALAPAAAEVPDRAWYSDPRDFLPPLYVAARSRDSTVMGVLTDAGAVYDVNDAEWLEAVIVGEHRHLIDEALTRGKYDTDALLRALKVSVRMHDIGTAVRIRSTWPDEYPDGELRAKVTDIVHGNVHFMITLPSSGYIDSSREYMKLFVGLENSQLLYTLAKAGYHDMVEALASIGTNVDHIEFEKVIADNFEHRVPYTALTIAPDVHMMKLLLDAKADLTIAPNASLLGEICADTPAFVRRVAVVRTVAVKTNEDCDIWTEIEDVDDSNAENFFKPAFTAVRMLLDAKASVRSIDMKGWTALHACVNDIEFRCRATTWQRLFQLLVDSDRKAVNMADDQGLTPIALLAFFGDGDNLKLLVRSGADLNVKDNSGTPLIIHALGEREVYGYMQEYARIAYEPWHSDETRIKLLRALIYGDTDLTATDRSGATVLIAMMRRVSVYGDSVVESDARLCMLIEEILEKILEENLRGASAKRRRVGIDTGITTGIDTTTTTTAGTTEPPAALLPSTPASPQLLQDRPSLQPPVSSPPVALPLPVTVSGPPSPPTPSRAPHSGSAHKYDRWQGVMPVDPSPCAPISMRARGVSLT